MIETKHLVAYIRKGNKSIYSAEEQLEYSETIVAKLRAYDRIYRDLKLMIATLCPKSNTLDGVNKIKGV